jgi:glyoxalase family protein
VGVIRSWPNVRAMALEGLHHITAITADARRNVDFYVRVLGLRLVKKTVNFDQPDVYHLYYGDEGGTPGSILTFFEFPGAAPGRHGDGMPYRVLWRVRGPGALAFWSDRLGHEGIDPAATAGGLRFADPEGLEHKLVVDDAPDAPLPAVARDIPSEHALLGFAGVRAYAEDRGASSAPLLDALGEELRLPPQYEARRAQLEQALTPITNPRAAA